MLSCWKQILDDLRFQQGGKPGAAREIGIHIELLGSFVMTDS